MTETGTTVAAVEVNAAAAAPVEVPAAVPQDDAAEAAKIVAAAEAAAALDEALVKEAVDGAEKVLAACVKSFRAGESAHKKGLLATGEHAADYIRRKMSPPLNASRAAAVQRLEGELAKWASQKVDVSEYIRHWAASDVFGKGLSAKAKDGVLYGHWRVFSKLLVRKDKDKATEHFVALPGMEEEATAYVHDCIATGRDRDDCEDKIKGMVRRHTDMEAEATAKAAAAAKAELDKAAAEVEAQRKQTAEATAKAKAAELAAAAEKANAEAEQDADKAAEKLAAAADLLDKAEKAKAELLEKQRAEQVASTEAELKRQKAAQEAKDAKDAGKRQANAQAADKRAADKAIAAAAGQDKRPPSPEANQGTNMLGIAKAGTVKDVAGMVVTLVTENPKSDDVLRTALLALKEHGNLGKNAKLAVQNALLAWDRADKATEDAKRSAATAAK